MKIQFFLIQVSILLFFVSKSQASYLDRIAQLQNDGNSFPLVENRIPVKILFDATDFKGVHRAIENLSTDFEKITGNKPASESGKYVLIIGTINHSSYIDQLIKEGKIDGNELNNKREKYIIQMVANPLNGIDEALVIAGSDKRGTIYGIYELSDQIGVSPWHYWADVPIRKSDNLYIKRGIYSEGEPKVKYRGIFLNDEAPSLSGWSKETFGGFNSKFYEHVFELILRLKGNFLWPAMWGNALYDDDPISGQLADEMGIVLGTSHHEPMGRAHDEWRRYGSGEWDYTKNQKNLTEFWTNGMERMKNFETVVTVGMRGDGDMAMSQKTNVALLEKIITDQRKIITKVTGKKVTDIPQVWALYKEVQDYYDEGMRVPDDVTLLLCDDNWGNVRKLPELNAKPRKGGYGIYYHFDYVGGPRNYKWLNVSQVPRIWEQLNLTYRYGVKELWVVNVGDLKPMEYPIQFFLDMAWDPDKFDETNLFQHTVRFCARQFGDEYAEEAANLLNLNTKYSRRVTPELLNQKTYSLHNYDEFKRVVDEYNTLLLNAMKLNYLLPEQYRDAYDQLILFPIYAMANLYEMYYSVAKNYDLAEKNDPEANFWANRIKNLYERDSLICLHYNKEIAGGKWNHMMDQTHIGYTYWQQPFRNTMPKQQYVSQDSITPPPPAFVEKDGYVSIEAQHFTRSQNVPDILWTVIADLGKTLSAVTTSPVTSTPGKDTYLEYDINFTSSGEITVEISVAPTLNFNANRGLRYAVSFDDDEEQIVNFNGHYRGELGMWQAESIIKTSTKHSLGVSGKHVLRFRPLDPGIVLEKILIDTGGLKPSYLGAPETIAH